MLRKCNDFLICVGILLVLSCLVFTVAFARETKTKEIKIINVNKTKVIKNKPVRQQQRKIKEGLKRMERKMERRKKHRKEKNNVSNI